MYELWVRLWREERGSEVIEYAVMLGMLVLTCIALFGALGTKIFNRWTDIFNAF